MLGDNIELDPNKIATLMMSCYFIHMVACTYQLIVFAKSASEALWFLRQNLCS